MRAKVHHKLKSRPKREIPGMKCNKQYHACPYIKECKEIKNGSFQWKKGIQSVVNQVTLFIL